MPPDAPEPEAQWPPRSPHEALLSTPGGRQRYRRMQYQMSPCQSPSKRAQTSSALSSSTAALLEATNDNDEEEDEETLRLKLQELQARLKLKKLQSAKPKGSGSFEARQPARDLETSSEQRQGTNSAASGRENIGPAPENAVQVPVSPVKKAQMPQEQTSPRRVQLGIDKGLKAKDVSLKRAPSVRNPKSQGGPQHEGYLRKTRTPNPLEGSAPPARPLTFSERLASARTGEASNAEKQDRIRKSRSQAFGMGQDEIDSYKKKAVDIHEEPLKAPAFSREEVLSKEWQGSGALRRSNIAPSVGSYTKEGRSEQKLGGKASGSSHDEGTGSFESYSSMHLSRRFVPHTVLTRHVSGKKIMNVRDLLRDVKAPDFSLPDVEQDIVAFGIVAKKSEPRAHKPATNNGKKPEDRGKYMVMNICDLDYELDLFLFNSGFDRFWKLTEGTLIAILNPTIMPPPPGRQDTGRFSLVINSDGDTIIEIGIARDLNYCQSVKKDGNPCGTWVNKKKTNFCEFHTNEAVRKTKASRIELNSGSGFGHGPKKRANYKESFPSHPSMKKTNSNYDWETKTQWFATRSMSAADLIDGKDQSLADKREREAHLKRRLESKEREREMMKKLGNVGDAAGKEYMKLSGSRTENNLGSSISSSQAGSSAGPDSRNKAALKSLGLHGTDRNIRLSPIKRKRPDSSQAGSDAGTSSALGWGSGLKDKLTKMREGEKLREDQEGQGPVRKKTRFVTEKGIREAGRESLGVDLSERQVSLDDDDDELVIVR